MSQATFETAYSDTRNPYPIYPMNREQRRKHFRDEKRDPDAIYCPHCTHKTKHVALPEKKNWREEGLTPTTVPCQIVCVACGNILRHNITGVVPYEYATVAVTA